MLRQGLFSRPLLGVDVSNCWAMVLVMQLLLPLLVVAWQMWPGSGGGWAGKRLSPARVPAEGGREQEREREREREREGERERETKKQQQINQGRGEARSQLSG